MRTNTLNGQKERIARFTATERRLGFVTGVLSGAATVLFFDGRNGASTVLFGAVGIIALIRVRQLK